VRSGLRFVRRLRRRLPLGREHQVIRSARRYWDARYASTPAYVSSGHIGLSDDANRRDFTVRADLLGETLQRLRLPNRDRLLDAGCGNGLFVTMYVDLGFVTTAFDISSEAIAQARKRFGDVCEWSVADIESFQGSQAFDFVVCLGALMCIVDDDAHARAFRSLASLTAQGGYLILEEMLVPPAETARVVALGSQIRMRALDVYKDLIADTNLELAEHIRFRVPLAGQEKSLLVLRGTGAHRYGTRTRASKEDAAP
jgi:SAM-dependent methyltransferase